MSNCAIVGINWGDEGKGRMVDLLTERFDYVIRYQGGGNAGHTVVNEYGKFALHLLPSGIFRKGVVNILGNGVALDLENLDQEMQTVIGQGVTITPENLKISERASLVLPWHRLLDGLEEARLADKKFGSTKQGIAPFYSDKYQKKTILAGELFYPEKLDEHIRDLLTWKNLTLTGVYGAEPVSYEDLKAWFDEYGAKFRPFICDTGKLLKKAAKEGKSILFEAQLGSLRDLDYGIHPYTTSSNAIAAYAPVGSGLPSAKIDQVVGVVKAYSTCVGEGPFVCEWFGEEAEKLREAGGEYGAKTGRPRRVGPIDIVATRYGVECQGATDIALTKMDVMSYMDRIPICAHYELNGEIIDDFPFPAALDSCKPVIEYMDGWQCDISGIRRWEDLPVNAQKYVEYIEEQIGCHIRYVSVGPERDAYIEREPKGASEVKEYSPVKEGKVREIYDIGENMILVATDRISCFDVILNNTVTKKGTVLTQMSKFWFDFTKDIVKNHMISVDTKDMPEYFQQPRFDGNSMLVKKLTMLPVECIVRGYITGSGWKSYCENGTVCGIKLPEGLQESEKLPEPIYTPSTKAEIGDHDENISFEQSIDYLEKQFPGKGLEYATKLRDYTIALYKKCADYALTKGIIIADTKFEFGLDENGEIVVGDEMLTPDSSRFWPLASYEVGHAEPSYDKQFARDWLKANPHDDWTLPQEVVDKTIAIYLEGFEKLTGEKLS